MVSLFCLIKRQEYKSSTKGKAKCYSFLERKERMECPVIKAKNAFANIFQALKLTGPPVIKNSYEFPIVRNCGQ